MDQEGFDEGGMHRRAFLRRGLIAGGVVWVAPVVQTLAASPAFAQQDGSPAPCFHSVGGAGGGGCMSACTQSGCTGDACNGFGNPDGPCTKYCPQAGGDNPCCNAGLCDPKNFTCVGGVAVYSGSLAGCPT